MPRRTDSSEVSSFIRVLSERIAPHLTSLERSYSLMQGEAADALQDSLLLFATHRSRVENPISWLYVVLRNRCRRIARKRSQEPQSMHEVQPDRLAALPQPDTPSDARLRLEAVLGNLSTRSRSVLWMRFVADMSWIEIGDSLGCQASGAKKAVYRAVKEARVKARELESSAS